MIARLRHRQIKDEHQEQQMFSRRIWLSFGLVIAAVLFMLLRYVQLQVLEHESLTTRSEQNRIKLQAVVPNRGLVFDRNGTLLADNRPAYRLEITPERVEDMATTLDELGKLVRISEAQRARFLRLRNEYKAFDGVPIRFTLDEPELARFSVNRHRFPGVDTVPYLIRHYPHGEVLTHVLGYVGRISAGDLTGLDANNYRGSTHIGVTGVEQSHEEYLHGLSGIEHIETNAQGRVLNTQFRQDPVPGEDLYLTLDLDLQKTAWEALGDAPGAVVAIDPTNGDILALVSKPGFDPNLFVNGISTVDYKAILEKPGRALFNRALQGTYEPGSTMKPFVALAGLENGIVATDTLVFSNGAFFLPNSSRPYRDWLKNGHGWVTVKNALEQSVNTYFYQLVANLGIEALHDYLALFGFGIKTGVDLNNEAAGLNPSPEWKVRAAATGICHCHIGCRRSALQTTTVNGCWRG
jgi:penicillin-binding protein 2